MKFYNRQFGELEFQEEHIINFPSGLIGFEENKKFLIVNDEDSQPFRWLLSLECDDLSFPLLDPTLILPEYNTNFDAKNNPAVFVVAALSERIEKSYVNLRSPIIINKKAQHGEQVVLDDDSLPVQYPLVPAEPQTVRK